MKLIHWLETELNTTLDMHKACLEGVTYFGALAIAYLMFKYL